MNIVKDSQISGVTILLPCLNEAETIGVCIEKSLASIHKLGLKCEVLVADNGSSDASIGIATALGATVIHVERRGYGAALLSGIQNAKYEFIIMADADDSYELDNLESFVLELQKGADLVIGDRFAGGIQPGAMPFLHKYLGNPVLSYLGRLFFHTKIRDFHCGIRGFYRPRILSIDLKCEGMEFATEMIVKSTLNDLSIMEVPTKLFPDGRSRKPHLRTWRDGWRHLKFLFMHAPNWLFALPGFFCIVPGLFGIMVLSGSDYSVGNITFGLQTLVFSTFLTFLGTQIFSFWIIAKMTTAEVLSERSIFKGNNLQSYINFGPYFASLIFIVCFVGLLGQIREWVGVGFGSLDPFRVVRQSLMFNLGIIISLQIFFTAFIVSVLNLQRKK
jgi:glycosyltransferase involved in cell wall biosynthesis